MSIDLNLKQLPEKLWNGLSEDNQRYVKLIVNRDTATLVGLKVPQNYVEWFGDAVFFPLYLMVDLPRKLAAQNMLWIVAEAASAATLLAVGLYAHPVTTLSLVSSTIASLPRISYIYAKFSLGGLLCRTVGRMFNTALMKPFYK